MSSTVKLPPRILRPLPSYPRPLLPPANGYSFPWISNIPYAGPNSAIPITNKQVICQICNQSKPQHLFVRYFMCEHYFCQGCIKQYLGTIFQDPTLISSFPITCPHEGCSQRLDQQSQFRYLNPWRLKYQQDRIGNSTPCPGVDCPEILVRIQGQPLYCSKENKYFCSECRRIRHKGECILEAQKQILRNNNYTMCPKCKRVIEKVYGCDHVACNCGNYFCFNCRGPTHSGKCLKNNMDLTEHQTSFFDWTGFALPYLFLFCIAAFPLFLALSYLVLIFISFIKLCNKVYLPPARKWILVILAVIFWFVVVLIASPFVAIYSLVFWIKQYWLVTLSEVLGRMYYRSTIGWKRWVMGLTIESELLRDL